MNTSMATATSHGFDENLPARSAHSGSARTGQTPAQQVDAAALQRRLAQLHTAMGTADNGPVPEPARAQANARDAGGRDVPAPLSPIPAGASNRTQPQALWMLALLPFAGVLLWWTSQHATTPSPTVTVEHRTASEPAQRAVAAEPLPALANTASGNTAVAADATENVLRERLEGWRLAWASRDVEAYLAHYSPRFVAANGQTHSDWAAARRRIISSRPDIVLHLSAIQWQALSPDRWKVRFLQDYAAGGHVEKQLPKTLELVLEDGRWNIVSERTTSVDTARP